MTNLKELSPLFQEVVEMHKGILYKVARTYCKNEEDRQDLIQEMLVQIWKSLPKYNSQFAITTWMYRISLNVAISFYRKNVASQGREIFFDEQTLAFQEVDNAEKEQQLQLLEQFISELNSLDKALIILYLEEKSHAEISDILGISISNISTKVGRIKEKLKIRFTKLNS